MMPDDTTQQALTEIIAELETEAENIASVTATEVDSGISELSGLGVEGETSLSDMGPIVLSTEVLVV